MVHTAFLLWVASSDQRMGRISHTLDRRGKIFSSIGIVREIDSPEPVRTRQLLRSWVENAEREPPPALLSGSLVNIDKSFTNVERLERAVVPQ